MRLIDADALKRRAITVRFFGKDIMMVPTAEIDNAPTIDAVEVVRCKDCIHKENWDAHIDRWWCKVHRGYFADDYFCADGREDGEE